MSSSKSFLFSKEVHLKLGVRMLLELYCSVVIKHVAFFTIWAKLTVAFTCTRLPLILYTSVFGCGCGFGFQQKFWRIDGFGEKRHGSVDLHTPIHSPLHRISEHWRKIVTQHVTETMCQLLTLVKNHNLNIFQSQLELVIEHFFQFMIGRFL